MSVNDFPAYYAKNRAIGEEVSFWIAMWPGQTKLAEPSHGKVQAPLLTLSQFLPELIPNRYKEAQRARLATYAYEVDASGTVRGASIASFGHDEENDCQQQAYRGDDGPRRSCLGSSFDLGLGQGLAIAVSVQRLWLMLLRRLALATLE